MIHRKNRLLFTKKGCMTIATPFIMFLFLMLFRWLLGGLHRDNKTIIASLEVFYRQDKDKLEIVAKDISTIKTRYKAFDISSGKHYMLNGWDDKLMDTTHYEIPPYVDEYFHNHQDGFGGMEYVKDVRFSIPSMYRTKACDNYNNAKLTYCFHGVDSLLKDSLYRDYLILDYNNPNIPENRCKLIRILDYNWLIEIRD